MCSIMGYCGPGADYERFMEGFEKTISRGPDDSRVVDTGLPRRECSRFVWETAMWSAMERFTALRS